MINITTEKLEIESELKKKIEFICDFCNTKPNITRTNLSYVEPIKGITFEHLLGNNENDLKTFSMRLKIAK